jgi:hypothetical protein
LADAVEAKAKVAAFAATGGRDDEELDAFWVDGLRPSLPFCRKVLSMRVLFSGDGVRDSSMEAVGPGDSEWAV